MSGLPELPPPESGIPSGAASDYLRLFEAARLVNAAQPWRRIDEGQLFAVVSPVDGSTGFVSVTGMRGEHFAVMLYLGTRGLYTFWDSRTTPGYQMIRVLFEAPMITVSFEDRAALEQDDVNLLRSLGLKFRGRHQWPVIRAVEPGYLGEIPAPAQARFLSAALEQLLDLLPRLDRDPGLLKQAGDVDYLTRIPRHFEGRRVWKEAVLSYPPVLPSHSPLPIPHGLLRNWTSCPPGGPVEVDLFLTPLKEQMDNSRVRLLYVILVVDAHNGLVLAQDVMGADPALEDMWNACGLRAAALMVNSGLRPVEIRARHSALIQGLEGIPGSVGTRVVEADHLPMAMAAAESILSDILGGPHSGWGGLSPGV
ncbi:MAG: hypothetical protein U1F77_06770 [Kiritimatiellia bacterium]